MRRLLNWLLMLLIGLYGALIALALFSDRLIFQAQPATYTDSDLINAARGFGAKDVRVVKIQSSGYNNGSKRTAPALITAVYLPNPDARFTLLFSHGNAEDLGADLSLLDIYRRAGFAVFAYDYRGYGTSQGQASEAGAYADVEASYQYLTDELGVPAGQVIAIGRSLGSAMAIHLAATRPTAGLVAEAPFVSAFRVLTQVRLLPWDKFNNAAAIRQVRVPVLVIQGDADEVVPFQHGQRIYELANAPKQCLWVHGAHHNDVMLTAEEKYIEALRAFAGTLRKQQADSGSGAHPK